MEVFEQQNKRQTGDGGRFFAGLIVGVITSLLVVCVGYVGYQIQQRVESGGRDSQQVNAGSPERYCVGQSGYAGIHDRTVLL